MEGGRSFVSSRFFASDLRPTPNIVAFYQRPRHKIRRDATHVFGGMFGWNTPAEHERALRAEISRIEEEVATTSGSVTLADSALAEPPQRCANKPTKRLKRRAFAPLVDMGTSILSLHFQQLMRRRQHPEEDQNEQPVSLPLKRPLEPADDAPAVPASPVPVTASKNVAISGSIGDAPIAKKLRLTISTAPPPPIVDISLSTTLPVSFLQMPPSPPDTSSNASGCKAPTEEQTAGPISTSTPKYPLPSVLDFEIDSESESESSSESSSDLDSDSPDLSSSTSTRSTTRLPMQNRLKDKHEINQNLHLARSDTTSVASTSVRGPSTPLKKKRPTHKPGWIGWVQTEESPDHSRLIRLDDAPVILGRRTRSGREFKDPPLPPPSRRKSIAPATTERPQEAPKPQPQPHPHPRPKVQKSRRRPKTLDGPTGEKSKQQSAWQEAHRRAANGASSEEIGAAVFSGVEEGQADGEAEGTVEQKIPDWEDIIGHADVITPTIGSQDISSGKDQGKKKDASTRQNKHGSSSKAGIMKFPTSTSGEPDSKLQPSQHSPSTSKVSGFSTKDHISPGIFTKDYIALGSKNFPSGRSGTQFLAAKKSGNAKRALTSPIKLSSERHSPNRQPAHGQSDAKAAWEVHVRSKGGLTVNRPRVSSPSPPEKAKRPTGKNMAASKTTPTVSSTKPTPSGEEKPGNTSILTSSGKPSTERHLFSSGSGKATQLKNSSFSALGKRKEPTEQATSSHFKKRKLSQKSPFSSDESDNSRPSQPFVVHPFERRAKQVELTRKGVSGDAYKLEMDKWVEGKRLQWKERERGKTSSGDGEKSGSDGKASGDASKSSKTAESGSGTVGEYNTPEVFKDASQGAKDISNPREAIRISDHSRVQKPTKEASHSDNPNNSPKVQKTTPKLVWNGDWGMGVAKVSLTGAADGKNKINRKLIRDSSERWPKDRISAPSSTNMNPSVSFAARMNKPKLPRPTL